MKYSVAILLALFGIAAASFLNDQDDVKGRVPVTKRHNHHHDDDDHKLIVDEINFNEYKNFDNEHSGKTHHKVDKTLLKQKIVLQLLSNLQQKNTYEDLVQIGNNFNPVEYYNKINNNVAVKKFFKNYENNNFLPLDEVFTPTNQQHQNQAAQLFAFIYSAQDWHTLVQAAAWARDRFNPEQFAYVFTAVVLNHPSTQGIVIPALYEIIPHAFVPATALHKIYLAKVNGYEKMTVKVNYTNQNQNNINYNNDLNIHEKYNVDSNENTWGPHNPNHVYADNTGSLINHAGIAENPENKMSYFTEDIGINDIHARFHIQYPLFFGVNNNKNYYTSNLEYVNKENTINNNQMDIKRGEAFYFAHQQLYARYVLERLSNNLPIPHPINFNDKIETGYNPNLQHANGQAVPVRPPYTKFEQQQVEDNNNNLNALLPNNNQAQKPHVYEKRIQEAAESGFILNHDGTKTKLNKVNAVGVLANLIAAPASSLNPDYYGDYFSTAKNAIGNIVDPNNQNGVAPGVVSKYTTAARDPAYYQFLAKLNLIFKNLQNKQGPYTKQELVFHGVKIENVDISDLVTYFETDKVNVNNAIPTVNKKHTDNIENVNMDYNVKFQRLTNKPFNVKMIVKSDKTTDAIVRFFLGPKYDSNGQRFTLPQASQYFVQLDQFMVKLNRGENVINRQSQETNVNVQEPVSFRKLWNRIELALQGQQPFYVNKGEHQVLGLPLRNQLPKGKRNGQQFVLYVTINPVNNMYNDDFNMDMSKEETMDIVSDELYYKNHNKHSTMDSDEMYYKNDKYNNMESSEKYDVKTSDNVNFYNYVRDHRSIGFPFDRPVVDVNYNTANQYFKTVTIYHKVNNY